MALKDQLASDLKSAMKAGDAFKVGVLRLLNSALQNKSIELRGQGKEEGLADGAVLQVLEKEAKKRRESIALYRQGGREDLASQEEKELRLIEAYLPAQMSEAEIRAAVENLRAKGALDFKTLMKAAMRELKGKAGGEAVSKIVKELVGD